MSGVKKRIVVPVYNDRRATNGWERPFQEDPECSVVVYEKDEEFLFDRETKTEEGFRISSHGQGGSFTFLYHICKYYDDLCDVEIFTKTHVHRQIIRINESIIASHLYDHLELWNDLRLWVWTTKEKYEEIAPRWLLLGQLDERNEWALASHHSMDDLGITGLAKEFHPSIFSPSFSYEPRLKYLVRYPNGLHHKHVYHMMKSLFPDYALPDVYIGRQENVWSVKKEVILYHPKELYTDMLASIVAKSEWDLDVDTWCQFWPLFWNETIRRINL